MNILDVIIILSLCPIIISGYKKGLINQAVSIIALIAGAWIASSLGSTVGSWMYPLFEKTCDNPTMVAYISGFTIIFIAVCLLAFLLGKLVGESISSKIPKRANKFLGLILGALSGFMLFCTLYHIFEGLNKAFLFTDMKGAFFTKSILFPYIKSAAQAILPNLLNAII